MKIIQLSIFVFFFALSLKVAAAPARRLVDRTYDWHVVSALVKSHIRGLPHFHGISVRPSGFFPSDLLHPVGSRMAGMPHVSRALFIKSLIVSCLDFLP